MEEKILESVWGAIYLTVLILPLFYFAGSFIIITIDELKFTKILRVTKICVRYVEIKKAEGKICILI